MDSSELILSSASQLQSAPLFTPTPKRELEFFTAQINYHHTRKASD